MKTANNVEIKAINANMKAIREIMKSIKEDDEVMDSARNVYTYENAQARNRERFYDLMRQINEMAEHTAMLYNCNRDGFEEWMFAKAEYNIERIYSE